MPTDKPSTDKLTPESIVRWGDIEEWFATMNDALSKARKQIKALQQRVRVLEKERGK